MQIMGVAKFNGDPEPGSLERPPTDAEKRERWRDIPWFFRPLPWKWRNIYRYVHAPVPLDPRTHPKCYEIVQPEADGTLTVIFSNDAMRPADDIH
jgi:hypothetical protein